jgi:heat-inducible transcriptional repressor
MLEERQQKLLELVIEQYVATAEPVGSRFLVEVGGLDWSEATVRNELRTLEEAGYLTHPHTSAGRIPTIDGYRFYIDTISPEKLKVSKAEMGALEKTLGAEVDLEAKYKLLAKTLVALSGETAILAFSSEKMYYTGLSNLFSKPDFAEMQLVANVSRVFDRCEEYLPRFYDSTDNTPRCYLGSDHPFGEMLSCVATRLGENGESLLILLGPQRMNYKHNWSLLKKIRELI